MTFGRWGGSECVNEVDGLRILFRLEIHSIRDHRRIGAILHVYRKYERVTDDDHSVIILRGLGTFPLVCLALRLPPSKEFFSLDLDGGFLLVGDAGRIPLWSLFFGFFFLRTGPESQRGGENEPNAVAH